MGDYLKQILDKLNHIDARVAKLEINESKAPKNAPPSPKQNVSEKKDRDSLFPKVVALLNSRDELTAAYVEKQLSVDKKRAETLLDQLEAAGYGTCYWSEI